MRVAVMVRKLNLDSKDTLWRLVLPPWDHLYHWQSRKIGRQDRIPWSLFFDVESINQFTPVVEFSDFIVREGESIDAVYYLQGYKEGWGGHYEEKHDIRDCLENPRYYKDEDVEEYRGKFWNFEGITAKNFNCISIQGGASSFAPFLTNSAHKSIMLDRAENMLHDYFGDTNYWAVRRSMRFAQHLVKIADEYRAKYLDSNDEDDDTVQAANWSKHRKTVRSKRGGKYMCVHLRRKDFVYSRKDQIPTIPGAAEQLLKKLESHQLDTVFVATDAPLGEFEELKDLMKPKTVLKFQPSTEQLKNYKDGGMAIVDQSICSHATYFIGSYESTFTFRIQEEREIMGFPLKDTFDMLCADGKEDCEKGSQWKIEWGDEDAEWSVSQDIEKVDENADWPVNEDIQKDGHEEL